MENTKGITKVQAAILVAVIAIAAIAGGYYYYQMQNQRQQSDQESQKLIVATSYDPNVVDPHATDYLTGFMICANCYDTLVNYDADKSTIEPNLATSWDISADGKVYTFTLRNDVNFASGYPFNASVAKWSLERIMKLGLWGTTVLGIPLGNQPDIQVINDYKFKITLAADFPPFLAALTHYAGSMIDQTLALQHETGGDLGNAWLNQKSAGSGPFVMTEYTKGDRIELVRNEKYWKTAPKLKEITIKVVPEASTQRMLLEAGDIDIAMDLMPQDLAAVGNKAGIKLSEETYVNNYFLCLNLAFAPLNDSRVREAVRYAIDYDGLIVSILKPQYAFPLYTLQPKGLPGFDAVNAPHKNVTKARELMAAAGVDGFDTTLYIPPGAMTPGVNTYETVALKLKNDLAEIGIIASIVQMDWDPLVTNFRAVKNPMTLYMWQGIYPDAEYFTYLFASSKSTLAFRNAWNNTQWSSQWNQKYDPWVAQMEKTYDFANRTQMCKEILASLVEDGPYVALFGLNTVLAMNDRVNDWYFDPMNMLVFSTAFKTPKT